MNNSINNSNNSINNSNNSIKNCVKGLTACRAKEDQASYRQVTGKLDITDCIGRHDAISIILNSYMDTKGGKDRAAVNINVGLTKALHILQDMPSAQPGPLFDDYMKAVWTWLLDYQIKAAELKGRYTPYEVLSWVANDWRKEHDGSD